MLQQLPAVHTPPWLAELTASTITCYTFPEAGAGREYPGAPELGGQGEEPQR